jgi:hypothetical protein
VGEVSPLNQLYERFRERGFEFYTVYVREPHPGEHYHEHRSWEQKVRYACECREQDGIQTRLLVDDLDGTVHRAFGEMPNMVYIIGKDGRIVYKSMWTHHGEIEAMLESLVQLDEAAEKGLRLRSSYTEKVSFVPGYAPEISARVLGRAGPKAAEDFRGAIGGARPGA